MPATKSASTAHVEPPKYKLLAISADGYQTCVEELKQSQSIEHVRNARPN